MREVTLRQLQEELGRHQALVTGTKALHPDGPRMHAIGEAITPDHVRVMGELGIDRMLLLEPGEDERTIQKTIGSERVEPGALVAGDLLLEDVAGASGIAVASAGTVLGQGLVDRLRGKSTGTVAIRKRAWAAADEKVAKYLAANPPPARNPMATDSRVSRMTAVASIKVRPLLIARARVLVAVADEFLRSLLKNVVASAGHETLERSSPVEIIGAAVDLKPDVVLIDGHDTRAGMPAFRRLDKYRNILVIACVDDGSREAAGALQTGVNITVGKPPRREVLLEAIRSGIAAMGREVRVKPGLLSDRRKHPRSPGGFPVTLSDPLRPNPLELTGATARDFGEGGLRIEYPFPRWDCLWSYTAHGVHPRHALYSYAQKNAGGRDLNVSFQPSPSVEPVAGFARVTYVLCFGGVEVSGLAFRKGGL